MHMLLPAFKSLRSFVNALTSMLTRSSGTECTIDTEADCWFGLSNFLRSIPHSAHKSHITVGCVQVSMFESAIPAPEEALVTLQFFFQ